MSDTLQGNDVLLSETPTGWLATALTYPRITVLGATREETLAALEQSRREWPQDAQ
jgi:hypothetical protein